MKKKLIIFFLLSTQLVLHAQEKIAVLEFTFDGDINKTEAKIYTDQFTTSLFKTKKFVIVEREAINKILEEQKFQKSGCAADECAVEIGRILAVRQVVVGTVAKLNNQYSLNLRLIDVETAKMVYNEMESSEGNASDFQNILIVNMARKLASEAGVSNNETGSSSSSTQLSETANGDVEFILNQEEVMYFIDGVYISQTRKKSLSLKLPVGKHKIKFSKNGFNDYEKEINSMVEIPVSFKVDLISGKSLEKNKVSTGVLVVNFDPNEATLYIDGAQIGTFDKVFQDDNIGIGEHIIKVVKNLYEDYNEKIKINEDEVKTVEAKLKPDFGSLVINTIPENANLYINDQFKGETPFNINMLKKGDYKIKISKNLYYDHEEKIMIIKGTTTDRKINLLPAFGKLIITTNPSNITVKLDDQIKGQTPLTIEQISSGKYHLTLSDEFYSTIERDIIIEDGKTNNLINNLNLEPKFSLINISGSPIGANVYLDGKNIGKLPIKNYKVKEGSIELKIESEEYLSQNKILIVQSGKTINETFDLVRHSGILKVLTSPPGANIILDGQTIGKSPLILKDIITGNHKIEINHPEYLSQSQEFSLALDESKSLSFKLVTYTGSIQQQLDEKISEKSKSSFKGWAYTILGVVSFIASPFLYEEYTKSESNVSLLYYSSLGTYYGSFGFMTMAAINGIDALLINSEINDLKEKLDDNTKTSRNNRKY